MQGTKRGEVALHGGASWMTAEKNTDLASPGQALGDVWSVSELPCSFLTGDEVLGWNWKGLKKGQLNADFNII